MDSSPPLKWPLSDLTLTLTPPSPPPQVLKPEDRGLWLIQLLLTCAAHASSLNLRRADACLRQITALSSVSGDSMQRLAARFATSLAVRLVKHWPGLYKSLNQVHLKRTEPDPARLIFTRAFPYLNFAYAIINRTILRAMSTERVVHVIDLGSGDPNLWGPLLRAISQAPRGPPHLKITCVNTSKHVLNNLGSELSELAEVLDIPFQYNSLNVGFRELTLDMLKVKTGEALAITSILNLHVLLAEDEHVATRFGVDGVRCFMDGFLDMVRSMSPKVFLVFEQEGNHNSARLMDRFVDALYYYSAVFDSVDAIAGSLSCKERLALEDMFGREIEDIVAFEGAERQERHEKLVQWRVRLGRARFNPVRLWSGTMNESLLFLQSYERIGFRVVNERGCLMIYWHKQPLYALSVWQSQRYV